MAYRFRKGRPSYGTMVRSVFNKNLGKRGWASGTTSRKRRGPFRRRSFKRHSATGMRGMRKSGSGGVSYTRYNHGPRRSKGKFQSKVMKAASAVNLGRATGTMRIEAPLNTQGVVGRQWLTGRNEGIGISVDELLSQTASTAINSRLFIEDVKMDYTMTNQSTSQIHLHVYDCTYRNDIDYGDTDQNPVTLFQRSVVDVSTSCTSTQLGITPFHGGRFGEHIKIDKVRKYIMNPGQVRQHKVYSKENWMCPRYRWDKTDLDIQAIARRTKATLFIAYGMPCNATTDPTNVGTAPAGVDIVWLYEAKYRWTADQLKNINLIYNAMATFSNPIVVDDDDGHGTGAITV